MPRFAKIYPACLVQHHDNGHYVCLVSSLACDSPKHSATVLYSSVTLPESPAQEASETHSQCTICTNMVCTRSVKHRPSLWPRTHRTACTKVSCVETLHNSSHVKLTPTWFKAERTTISGNKGTTWSEAMSGWCEFNGSMDSSVPRPKLSKEEQHVPRWTNKDQQQTSTEASPVLQANNRGFLKWTKSMGVH